MSKEPDKVLIEQLMQSGYTEADAKQTVREINETEQFLQRQDPIEPSPQFMQGLESQIRTELATAAAIVVIAIIAFRGSNKESTQPTRIIPPKIVVKETEAPELWELELVEFEEPVLQVDDLVISEVLELWTEAQWDIENLFGKENDHDESQITDNAGIRRISHRYA
jgi:hypothetical protein